MDYLMNCSSRCWVMTALIEQSRSGPYLESCWENIFIHNTAVHAHQQSSDKKDDYTTHSSSSSSSSQDILIITSLLQLICSETCNNIPQFWSVIMASSGEKISLFDFEGMSIVVGVMCNIFSQLIGNILMVVWPVVMVLIRSHNSLSVVIIIIQITLSSRYKS